ncbi:MAG: hypothetical protein M1827_002652 [Pycnora praestabilis]|nr:MAG: hypothetical protein M1827_002652 [Pycnora praestabilis]
MAPPTEKEKSLRGELYHAFTPELTAERTRCKHACTRFNNAGEVARRRLVELWRDIIRDNRPLPPPASSEEEDDALFAEEPWVEPPVHIDFGTNVILGQNVFMNFNCTILDTCLVSIGSRTLMGPNVSFYSATHPLDPELRNGTKGPELGKEIHVGEDVWIGGNVTILPGVNIGKGATVGAGSVVTKDIPAYHVAAGNPARSLRKIATNMDPEQGAVSEEKAESKTQGAEGPMASQARKLEDADTRAES